MRKTFIDEAVLQNVWAHLAYQLILKGLSGKSAPAEIKDALKETYIKVSQVSRCLQDVERPVSFSERIERLVDFGEVYRDPQSNMYLSFKSFMRSQGSILKRTGKITREKFLTDISYCTQSGSLELLENAGQIDSCNLDAKDFIYIFWHIDEFVVTVKQEERGFTVCDVEINRKLNIEVAREIVRGHIKSNMSAYMLRIFGGRYFDTLYIHDATLLRKQWPVRFTDVNPWMSYEILRDLETAAQVAVEYYQTIAAFYKRFQEAVDEHGGMQSVYGKMAQMAIEELIVDAPIKAMTDAAPSRYSYKDCAQAQYVLKHTEVFSLDILFPDGVFVETKDTCEYYNRQAIKADMVEIADFWSSPTKA